MSKENRNENDHVHIKDERLMELALSPVNTVQNGEGAHLASCSICAAKLEAERELTVSLMTLKPTQVPVGLSTGIQQRFEIAWGVRKRRNLLLGLGVFTPLMMAMVLILTLDVTSVFSDFARSLGALLTLAQTTLTIAQSAPLLSLSMIVSVSLSALFLMFVLSRLATGSRLSAKVASGHLKYSEPSSVPRQRNGR